MMLPPFRSLSLLLWLTACTASSFAANWRSQILPVSLNVGYAVRAIDMNRDGKLDIAIVDAKRFLWLEAPEWKTHVIHATPEAKSDNVCFAPNDIDGDGDLDFAIGFDWQPNNTQSGGAVGWLESPADPRDPWAFHSIDTNVITVHRMHWCDMNGDRKWELIVAPLKGPRSTGPGFEDQGVELLQYSIPTKPKSAPWTKEIIDRSQHVMHNFQPIRMLENTSRDELLTASFEGVHWFAWDQRGTYSSSRLCSGFEGPAPNKGSSEVRLGSLGTGKSFIATIEPWHGNEVVVYDQPGDFQWKPDNPPARLWQRTVLDKELKWGHAVACTNLDNDPDEELVIGVRDDASPYRCGVRVYDRQVDGTWKRQLIEPGQVAVEDLVTADLNSDGKTDIIAVGRASKNAVVYWND